MTNPMRLLSPRVELHWGHSTSHDLTQWESLPQYPAELIERIR